MLSAKMICKTTIDTLVKVCAQLMQTNFCKQKPKFLENSLKFESFLYIPSRVLKCVSSCVIESVSSIMCYWKCAILCYWECVIMCCWKCVIQCYWKCVIICYWECVIHHVLLGVCHSSCVIESVSFIMCYWECVIHHVLLGMYHTVLFEVCHSVLLEVHKLELTITSNIIS